MIVDYIDSHRQRFGVEPICRVLSRHGVQIAPSGYYAYKNRRLSRRALRDAALEEIVEATFFDRAKSELEQPPGFGRQHRPGRLHGTAAEARPAGCALPLIDGYRWLWRHYQALIDRRQRRVVKGG